MINAFDPIMGLVHEIFFTNTFRHSDILRTDFGAQKFSFSVNVSFLGQNLLCLSQNKKKAPKEQNTMI